MVTRSLLLAVAVVLLSSPPSRAQEVGQIGVTLAYPAAIGVIWHAMDQLAIRPDFSFSDSSSDTLGSATTLNFGVSGLWYFQRWDNLRAYISPRFGYERISTSPSTTVLTSAPTANGYSGAGSFGLQYRLHERFSVFGETGLQYSHLSTTSTDVITGAPDTSSSHSWSTRAGVGMIFYF
jgi:hypothetical protein